MPGPYVNMDAYLEVENIFTQIFPDAHERTRLLKHYAESLFVGVSNEKYVVQIYGSTNNGKTFLNNVLIRAFPQLVGNISSNEILAQRRSSNKPQDWLAVNRSKRILTCEEPPAGQKLDSGLLKELSGNGIITAREMYGKPYTFQTMFKLYISTNRLIQMEEAGAAEARRLHTFEAPNEFVEKPDPTKPWQFQRDRSIEDKFMRNDYKIALLTYLAKHFKLYQEEGLGEPIHDSDAHRVFNDYIDKQDFVLEEELWKRVDITGNMKDVIFMRDLHAVLKSAGYTGKKGDLNAIMKEMAIREAGQKLLEKKPYYKFVSSQRVMRMRGLKFKDFADPHNNNFEAQFGTN
jgi:hypothetical protein